MVWAHQPALLPIQDSTAWTPLLLHPQQLKHWEVGDGHLPLWPLTLKHVYSLETSAASEILCTPAELVHTLL